MSKTLVPRIKIAITWAKPPNDLPNYTPVFCWVLKETPSLNKTCVKQTKDEASTSCHLPSSPEGVEESLLLEIPFHQSAPYWNCFLLQTRCALLSRNNSLYPPIQIIILNFPYFSILDSKQNSCPIGFCSESTEVLLLLSWAVGARWCWSAMPHRASCVCQLF